ncbi:MAG: hypothetical protein K5882_02435 [Bacteroidales bacterium]|nr:hypothetical protein [Bacteroidales bacterium]
MKRLTTLIILLLSAIALFAQAPGRFSYQAAVRNARNIIVADAPVGVRVSILQGCADGNVVYVETHTVYTNSNGLLTVEIGGGKVEQGRFEGIDWANGPYFLKTETDPDGGSNYGVTITQQLLSVPYALYANEAANGFSGDYNDLKNKPMIPQSVGELANDAGYITLGDLPNSSKSDGTGASGVVQTAACGEIDLCVLADQLTRMETALLPTVTTSAVNDIMENMAVCGGDVMDSGLGTVTGRGVCWGTEHNPTVDGNHTSNGTGTGAFTSQVSGLVANTTYYIRSYATNSVGTAYGEEFSFTTAAACAAIMLPYSDNFDSYTTSTTMATGVEPECWTQVLEDVTMTDANRPQLCYRSDYAHSGNYSLRLVNRGVYAMPLLDHSIDMRSVRLEMYVRQPKAVYRLQVGVMNENGDFEMVTEINNTGTEMEHVTIDFSSYTGNGHRIAFRNTLGGANYVYSYNYIDDIGLYVVNPVGGDTTEVNNCTIQTLPFSENFDGYTTSTVASTGVQPACWELVQEDVAMTDASRPQLFYKSSFAHSGDYTLKMQNRCVYAMPALSEEIEINQLRLEMYLRQANAAYQLEVGVWDGQEFAPVKRINNSTTNVEYVVCDFTGFTGTGHRIAFRNVLGSGNYVYSYNYIDDITLKIRD